jgi:uncharacterized damage-inducible protein DinB
MKEYFARLLNYDRHENLLITGMILEAGSPQKPVQLIAHLLAAQQVWLSRCEGKPAPNNPLWPDWPADSLIHTIEHNHSGWSAFLETITDEDLDKIVSYKNSRGESFENRLIDILGHMINHGTHHRAQVGQHLKMAGVETLPYMDYIFYIRELN